MRHLLSQAKQDKVTVKVRHTKVMICGSARVGKTCLTCLLKGDCIPENYKSTNFGDSIQIVVVKRERKEGEKTEENITWEKLGEKQEKEEVSRRLLNYIRNKNEDEEHDELGNESINSTEIMQVNSHSVVRRNKTSTTLPSTDNEIKDEISKIDSENEDSKLKNTGEAEITVENEIASISANKSSQTSEITEEIWDIITLLDTGGQPQFINLLPVISKFTAVTFVVLNAKYGIEEELVAEYSDPNFKTHRLKYNNKHLLESLLLIMKESSKLEKKAYLEDFKTEISKTNKKIPPTPDPAVCFVGTHFDEVDEKDRQSTLKTMCNAIDSVLDKFNDKEMNVCNISSKVLAEAKMTPDNTEGMKFLIDEFRNFVYEKGQELQHIYNIPITWLILELELRKAKDVYLSFDEVREISRRIFPENMFRDADLIAALKFFHDFGVLLYFDDVKGFDKFVIRDINWLFEVLSKLISEALLKDTRCQNNDCRLFLKEGILNKRLLNAVQLNTHSVEKSLFLKLLNDLKIIASIPSQTCNDKQYFMPCILDFCPWDSCKEINVLNRKFGNSYEVKPLLIKFISNPIPRAFFCFLVINLIQLPDDVKWDIEPYHHSPGENTEYQLFADLITFTVTCKHSKNLRFFLSLRDKIFYLELQVRLPRNPEKKLRSTSVHLDIKNIVCNTIKQLCKQFGQQESDLKCGFLCEYSENDMDSHIVICSDIGESDDSIIRCEKGDHTYTFDKDSKIWFKVCILGFGGIALLSKQYGIEKIARYH